MHSFCPICGALLPIEYAPQGGLRFSCPTCPFVSLVTKSVRHRIYPKLKVVDDVILGEAAWENVDTTDIRCTKCEHRRAYFMQIQIRSADEPMTIFYKCCGCGYLWRD